MAHQPLAGRVLQELLGGRRACARRRRRRPLLEPLEERTLLSIQGVSLANSLLYGVSGNESSRSPSLSADGRWLVFESDAGNLVDKDFNGTTDVFVRDLATGTTTLVSINRAGTSSGDQFSSSPRISADGRFVLFYSRATNLVDLQSLLGANLYVRDLVAGTTTLVNLDRDGRPTSGFALQPGAVISANGHFVAFADSDSNLVNNDFNGTTDVFVRDLQTATTSLISVNASGSGSASGLSDAPAISADGRFVAFASDATDLVLGDTNHKTDVFLRDRLAGTTTLLSARADGMPGNGRSSGPVLSADGRIAAFVSDATDLAPGDANGVQDVFVRDVGAGVSRLVSLRANGSGSGNGASSGPVLSADGRIAAFVSDAADLAPGDTNGAQDVFVRDLVAGTTSLASTDAAGTASLPGRSSAPALSADGQTVAFANDPTGGNGPPNLFTRRLPAGTLALVSVNVAGTGTGNGPSSGAALSADGRVIAFASDASDLVAEDRNRRADVFVRDLARGVTDLASRRSPNLPPAFTANSDSSVSAISADGGLVVFTSNATNLVENDTNNASDVFVRNLRAGTTTLVSPGTGRGLSFGGLLSADGRIVAFQSTASALFPAGSDTRVNIFLRDLASGAITLATPDTSGTGVANGDCELQAISPDGRFVAFTSPRATNLVPGFVDANGGGRDLFVRDILGGVTHLVSVNRNGTAGGNASTGVFGGVSFSADGRFIVFSSSASDLVVGDNNHVDDVFVRDISTGMTTLVSVNAAATGSGDAQSSSSAQQSAISADGRFVVFQSNANDLVANDTNGANSDVFVRDLVLKTTRLVSVNFAGTRSGTGVAGDGSITPDGRFVVFSSTASNLVLPDRDGINDIFVRDLRAGTTTRASVHTGAGSAGGFSSVPQISADGRYVAFTSTAGDLVPGDTNGGADLFLRDLQAGRTILATVDRSGSSAARNSSASFFKLAADGRSLAFVSYSPDHIAGDVNARGDVFAFRIEGVGTLRGQVFDDLDGDGVRDPGELGIAASTVFLDSNGNGRLDAGEAQVVTDAGGRYAFTGLDQGTYRVALVMPPGARLSLPAPPGPRVVTLTAAEPEANGLDFGLFRATVDLATSAVRLSSPAVQPGGEATVTWTVRNLGTAAITEVWEDSVFLSADGAISADDTLLVVVTHAGGLAAQASYIGTARVVLPALPPGTYRVLVRADRRRAVVGDADPANNVAASDPVNLAVPELVVGTPLAGQFTALNQARYYRVTVEPGQALRLKLDRAAGSAVSELYVRSGELPTRWQYDARAVNPVRADPRLTIPFGVPGTYYVLAYSSVRPAGDGGAFTLTAEPVAFGITSIDQNRGDRGGPLTVRIRGQEFAPELRAKLDDKAGHRLDATSMTFVDPTDVYATFDLPTLPAGTYSLIVTQTINGAYVSADPKVPVEVVPQAFTATLKDALTVVDAAPEDVAISITSTATTRVGREFTILVTATNRSHHDVPAPLVEVYAHRDLHFPGEPDANVNAPLAGMNPGAPWQTQSIQALVTASEGPAGVLRPGQTGYLDLRAIGVIERKLQRFSVSRVAGPSTPIDFTEFVRSLDGDPAAAPWSTALAALRARYGPTWAQFEQGLRDQATSLARSGQKVQTVAELLLSTVSEAIANASRTTPLATQATTAAAAAGATADPGATDKATTLSPPNQDLVYKESLLRSLAAAFLALGATTAGSHLQKFLGLPGPDAGEGDPSKYDNASLVAYRVRAHGDALHPYFKFDEAIKEDVRKALYDAALNEQDGKSLEGPEKDVSNDERLGRLSFYYPLQILGTTLRMFVLPYSPTLLDLGGAFGSMQGSYYKVTDVKLPMKDHCRGKFATYSAKIEYRFTDLYNFGGNDLGGGWIAKPLNEAALALQQAGWVHQFHTEIDMEEPVWGFVYLPPKAGDSDECNPKPPKGTPILPPIGSSSTEVVGGNDPNDIAGPAGFGDRHWVKPGDTLTYAIRFENDPKTATAAAQDVVITQRLDPNLDWSTFELVDVGFGSRRVPVPAGLQSYRTSIGATNQDSSPLRVDLSIDLNRQTGVVTWTFRSVDPATGEVPKNVFAGFLPVDDDTGRGEGFVHYRIRPRADLPTGARVDATASIVFDVNSPVVTNTAFNTIDRGAPSSRVAPLPPETPSRDFVVRWGGADDAGGSGIAAYDLFVSIDRGAFTPWLVGTTDTSAIYRGAFGHAYAFTSVAVDNLGHREATPISAQALTRLAPTPPVVVLTGVGAVGVGQPFSAKGSFSHPSTGPFTATVDYGDGSGPVLLGLNADRTFTLAHTYRQAGTFAVLVQVTDRDGVIGRGTLPVTVAATPPTPGPGAPPPILPSSGFGRRRDAFVITLYRELLGRIPIPAELRSWAGHLAVGMPRVRVARAIALSSEHRGLVERGQIAAIRPAHAYRDAVRAARRVVPSRLALPGGPLALAFAGRRASQSTTSRLADR